MAPKTQLPAKQKTTDSSSGVINRPMPLPKNLDRNRFSSNKHYDRFLKLTKGTWHDKVVHINPSGPYADILEISVSRKWEKLMSPLP